MTTLPIPVTKTQDQLWIPFIEASSGVQSRYSTGMFVLPSAVGPSQSVNNPMREQFHALSDWWHEATDALSSPSRKVRHRAYQRIISLGHGVVPYILEDLRDTGGYWFHALEQIEGVSPAADDEDLTFEKVRMAWLDWGATHGLLR